MELNERNLNLEMPTMGGQVWWDTIEIDGWKIQQNKADGHCRILKPDNSRAAYGNEQEIKALFEEQLQMLYHRNRKKHAPYGIVFTGGGGKGAFEIGVWRYLHERGLDRLIDGISGASVGALNALLFANEDYQLAEKIWSGIRQKDMTPINTGMIGKVMAGGSGPAILRESSARILGGIPGVVTGAGMPVVLGVAGIASAGATVWSTQKIDSLKKVQNGISTQKRLAELIDENICWERVENTTKIIYCSVSASAIPHKVENISEPKDIFKMFGKKKYVCWSGLGREKIKEYVLASASLPIVYGGRPVDGHQYLDGGIHDNIPIFPLVKDGFQEIIVVHLNRRGNDESAWSTAASEIDLSGVNIYHVYPDETFDDGFWAMIQVNPELTAKRMHSGYVAAQKQLADLPWKVPQEAGRI